MVLDQLTETEKVVLLAIAIGNDFRKKAHNAQEYFYQFLPKDLNISGKTVMKKIRKAFDSLSAKGLIIKHPTKGSMTFELSQEGINASFSLKKMKE